MREIKSPVISNLTTLHLGGKAIAEIVLENFEDLELLPHKLSELGGRSLCIGRGSNLLVADGNLDLVLIRVNLGKNISLIEEKDRKVLISVDADTSISELMRYCHQNGLTGLEGLIGIPGSIGGATFMNAGSFGCETASAIHSITALFDNKIKIYNKTDIDFNYRELKFKNENGSHIILRVVFALTKSSSSDILKRMSLNFFKKKSRQPLTAWSAGCAFKNPSMDMPAWKLLVQTGFKGKQIGGMAFSEKHANFLINTGKGSATAAIELLNLATEKVQKDFNIQLSPEVRIIT